MRQPCVYFPSHIQNWDVATEAADGRYVAARPMGHTLFPWAWRWVVAYRVFIGKYDALRWED